MVDGCSCAISNWPDRKPGVCRTNRRVAEANTYLRPLHESDLREATMNSFSDRRTAGRLLAERLSEYANRSDVTVYGLPRGGMPVAYEVARALAAPLDVFLVSKVFEPGRDDVQVGTITTGGFEVFDTLTMEARGVDRRIAEREM